jgi:hypothetical protein
MGWAPWAVRPGCRSWSDVSPERAAFRPRPENELKMSWITSLVHQLVA